MRKLLCEAGWRGIRCGGAIKAYFERIARDDPDRRKIALVATAHHLVRVMAAMLRTGEAWREPTTTTMTTTTATTVQNRKDGCADGAESASPPRKTAVT